MSDFTQSKHEVIAAYGQLSKALLETSQAVTNFQIALTGADSEQAKLLMANPPHLPYWPKEESAIDVKVGKGGKEKKAKKERDPNAPKRPPSAYLEYQNSVRQDIRAAEPTLEYSDVLRKIASAWAAMSAEDKSVWTEITNRKTAAYEIEKANYVAQHGVEPESPTADSKVAVNGGEGKKRGRKTNAEKAAIAAAANGSTTLEKIAETVDKAPKADKKKSKSAPATPAAPAPKPVVESSSEESSDDDSSDDSDSDSSSSEEEAPPPPPKKEKKSAKKEKVEEPKKKKSKH